MSAHGRGAALWSDPAAAQDRAPERGERVSRGSQVQQAIIRNLSAVPAYIEQLAARVTAALGGRAHIYTSFTDEVAIELASDQLLAVASILRDDPQLRFEMLMDLSGVDYLDY